jgi:GT2 family glycosyltransferase
MSCDKEKAQVSVVIRTTGTRYKLPLLGNLLRSLSRQTVRDFELIIVCESNKEAIEKLVSKYFDKFKVIETGYWNRARTTNVGIKIASGEYVVLLDDDYTMDEKWLETMLGYIKDSPPYIACIGSACESVFKEALKYKFSIVKIFEKALSIASLWEKKAKVLPNGLIVTVDFGGMHVICRRKSVVEVGGCDEELNEPMVGDDSSIALKLWRKGYKNAVCPMAKVYHLERYVSKQIGKPISYYEGMAYSDAYIHMKYFDIIGFHAFFQIIYRILWGLAYSLRCRNLKILVFVLRGVILGFIRGFLRYKRTIASSSPLY